MPDMPEASMRAAEHCRIISPVGAQIGSIAAILRALQRDTRW